MKTCFIFQRHHFAQAICILNTSGCNIFENMSRKVSNLTLLIYFIVHYDNLYQLTRLGRLSLLLEEQRGRLRIEALG